MKRFTKKQIDEYAALTDTIYDAKRAAKDAVLAYNDSISAIPNPEAELEELNQAVEQLNIWIEDALGLMDDYFAERSREWQDSKGGQEYRSWMDSLETIDTDPQWVQEPEELYEPEVEVAFLQAAPMETKPVTTANEAGGEK